MTYSNACILHLRFVLNACAHQTFTELLRVKSNFENRIDTTRNLRIHRVFLHTMCYDASLPTIPRCVIILSLHPHITLKPQRATWCGIRLSQMYSTDTDTQNFRRTLILLILNCTRNCVVLYCK